MTPPPGSSPLHNGPLGPQRNGGGEAPTPTQALLVTQKKVKVREREGEEERREKRRDKGRGEKRGAGRVGEKREE